MNELWLYGFLDRLGLRNYRLKIMLMAFIGTHIPLIALVGYFALKSSADWHAFFMTVGVTLVATLVGTGFTLFVLNHLLRPVLATSHTLRAYKDKRDAGELPTHFRDEVGTLMADASATLSHLETVRDALEYIDARTGLPNRKKLARDLEKKIAAEKIVAICALRFGNYRRVAETLDLEAAEAATAEFVSRLKESRRSGAIYRIGEGDFVAVLDGGRSGDRAADMEAHLKGVLADCSGSIAIGDIAIEPVLSAGVSMAPQDGRSPEGLIDQALGALALTSGEMRVGFHSGEARQAAVGRLRLEQDLRRALTRDEFVLHYQPVIDLARGRTVGAEALIRWQHPEQGLLPPSRFIGAAEASGLIDPIGLWVMRKACAQLREWNDGGLHGMKLAVNLSAKQFHDANLIRLVDEAIRTAGIPANQLEIELTETAAMADGDHTRAMFAKLRDLGVSIAIDDFGTGYASMSYLRKLPFDKLKIDGEFITGVESRSDSQAICSALIALGKGLKLNVLAEGTETENEVRFLKDKGCDLFQGFFFSRPVPSLDFAANIDRVSLSVMAMTAGMDREREKALSVA